MGLQQMKRQFIQFGIIFIIILSLNTTYIAGQGTETPTPSLTLTATVVPTQPTTSTQQVANLQVNILSTQVAELTDKVENPSINWIDIMTNLLGGLAPVFAALIVAYFGNQIASTLEETRNETARQHQQNIERDRREFVEAQDKHRFQQNENELKVAHAQVVEALIPSLEQGGTPRRIAVTAISQLGNEILSRKLIELYGIDKEDPVFADEQLAQLKLRLIRDAGSKVRKIAVSAIDEIRTQEWHKGDDSILSSANLQHSNLEGANLEGAYLMDTNLSGAYLSEANLRNTRLSRADLRNTNLSRANLHEAHLARAILWDANLEGAKLFNANLAEVLFRDANLEGADLRRANLSGAQLTLANVWCVIWANDDNGFPAVLPDGIKWKPGTDMKKYTDPDHHEYKATYEKIKAIRKEINRSLLG